MSAVALAGTAGLYPGVQSRLHVPLVLSLQSVPQRQEGDALQVWQV